MSPDRPQFIGEARAKVAPEAASYWQAALFLLPDGESYLLAGTGGAESEFAPQGDSNGRVIAMTETEAYNWAASYLTIDTVEEYFDHLSEEI